MNQPNSSISKLKIIPVVEGDIDPLKSDVCFTKPEMLKVCFPVLLDGDLVMSTEHLGVGYLAAILRQLSIDVKIVEVKDDSEAIKDICNYNPHLIAFSLTMVTVSHATSFGLALKEALPNVEFLAGGPLATFLGSKLLKIPKWNFVGALVRGEGDIAIVRFVERFWTNRDYSDVPNLSYINEKEDLIDNPIGAPIADLDLLPVPVRDQFEFHRGKLPYIRLATTRGCT
ncbi:MAG: cobalamin-dependent protein, partial [Gammaproteobacteria bacterium]|nr:cobalamin-dependent protein [Gammaproteobacteria bacterium]